MEKYHICSASFKLRDRFQHRKNDETWCFSLVLGFQTSLEQSLRDWKSLGKWPFQVKLKTVDRIFMFEARTSYRPVMSTAWASTFNWKSHVVGLSQSNISCVRKWYSGSEPERDNLPGEWNERLDPLQLFGRKVSTWCSWMPKWGVLLAFIYSIYWYNWSFLRCVS